MPTTVEVPVRLVVTWLPVSREAIEDAPRIQAMIAEMIRLGELARQGFLGRVRCARCRRRIRCVWGVVHGMHYGRDCYLATFGPEASPW